MIIGLCGGGFPDVRRALQRELPETEIVEIPGAGWAEAGGVDVLVPLVAAVGPALMDAAQPTLIQQFGVGLQGVDMSAARDRGIPVAYVPAADTGNATAVAEITFLHLLALLRDYRQAQHNVTSQRIGQPCGSTLAGKVVTVLGVGAIGTALIERLNAFHAVPLGVGRRDYTDYPALAGLLPADRYYGTTELNAALARSHILVVCCPLNDQTRGLVGQSQLAAIPPGGYVVNVARGSVIDYAALREVLSTGHLAGAGLDVAWTEPVDPDDELLRENLTVTPHIGGATAESYTAMARAFATNVDNLSTGRPITNRAD